MHFVVCIYLLGIGELSTITKLLAYSQVIFAV